MSEWKKNNISPAFIDECLDAGMFVEVNTLLNFLLKNEQVDSHVLAQMLAQMHRQKIAKMTPISEFVAPSKSENFLQDTMDTDVNFVSELLEN